MIIIQNLTQKQKKLPYKFKIYHFLQYIKIKMK